MPVSTPISTTPTSTPPHQSQTYDLNHATYHHHIPTPLRLHHITHQTATPKKHNNKTHARPTLPLENSMPPPNPRPTPDKNHHRERERLGMSRERKRRWEIDEERERGEYLKVGNKKILNCFRMLLQYYYKFRMVL